MLEELENIDKAFFLFINRDLSNVLFDVVLPCMRNEFIWIPLYVLMAFIFLYKFRKKGGLWILWALLTAGVSDVVSSHLIKKTIMRSRPCQIQQELTDMVLRIDCGTGYSFTSSHATNHMTLAIFVIMTTFILWKGWRWLFLPWALVIGFAQIYVGVHYPFDVLAGFVLGALIGGLSAFLFAKYIGLETAIIKPSQTV